MSGDGGVCVCSCEVMCLVCDEAEASGAEPCGKMSVGMSLEASLRPMHTNALHCDEIFRMAEQRFAFEGSEFRHPCTIVQ